MSSSSLSSSFAFAFGYKDNHNPHQSTEEEDSVSNFHGRSVVNEQQQQEGDDEDDFGDFVHHTHHFPQTHPPDATTENVKTQYSGDDEDEDDDDFGDFKSADSMDSRSVEKTDVTTSRSTTPAVADLLSEDWTTKETTRTTTKDKTFDAFADFVASPQPVATKTTTNGLILRPPPSAQPP